MFTKKIFSLRPILRCRSLVTSPLLRIADPVMLPENAIVEKTVNQVTLIGRVGTEPLKKGTKEHPVVTFSLATHSNYRHETGELSQRTEWHRISVFKPSLREAVFTYLKKGQRIYVSGKINYGSVRDDKVVKNTTSIVADEVIFFQALNTNEFE